MDITKILDKHEIVKHKYDSEWVIPCECDLGTNDAHLWFNVKKNVGVCYRCNRAYDLVDLIQLVEGVGLQEALAIIKEQDKPEALLRQAVERLESDDPVESAKDDVEEVVLPPAYRPIEKRGMPKYALERGLDYKTCKRYGIGYCETGYFARRLIVPVYFSQAQGGTLATFVARYAGDASRVNVPKVLYPKGSKKSMVLFNEDRADKYEDIIITEGVFDAIRAGRNAVCLLGKHASQEQLSRLVDLGTNHRLIVMLDTDALDDAKALASDLALVCHFVYVARLPKGRKDPGECTAREIEISVARAERLGDKHAGLAAAVAGMEAVL